MLGSIFIRMGAVMKFLSAVMALLIGCAVAVGPVQAAERSATKTGFSLPANSGKKILLFRPTIKVGAQSTGGMFEPSAEWTDDARGHIGRSLDAYHRQLGNQVTMAPELVGDDARFLAENMALFSVVANSVIHYQFFVGNRLPTKKRDNRTDTFEWTLGPQVAELAGASDADYGLFIFTEDHYGSTGRKMLQVFAAMGGVGITSGLHIGYAGLVDLKTGDLLWINADLQMGGDVRNAEGAEKRVRQLLEEFPGSALAPVPTSGAATAAAP